MLLRPLRCLGIPALALRIAALAILAAPRLGLALEPGTRLGSFARQSWTVENGLPQNTVAALLQSRRGYLWVGTEQGLARFDGVGFRVFDHGNAAPFPDAEVRCLLDAAGGELWVGTGDGLAHWVHGKPALAGVEDGLPGGSVRGLVQTTDGAIWAWTEGGSGADLARWDGQRFQSMWARGAASGNGAITSIAAGADGDLWVGAAAGVARFHRGHWIPVPLGSLGEKSKQSSLVAPASQGDVLIAAGGAIFTERDGKPTAVGQIPPSAGAVGFLARLAGGTVAAATTSAVVLLAAGRASERFSVARQLPGGRIETIFADREGSLWVGANHGLARLVPGEGAAAAPFGVELLPASDPLAADAVMSIVEDVEGDLWVGTETGGLQILRDARFRILGAEGGPGAGRRDGSAAGLTSDATTAIVEDTRSRVWIGTRDAGVNRVWGGKTTSLTTANGLLSNVVLSLAAAPDGAVWLGTPDGLNRVQNGRGGDHIESFTSADGLPDDFIRSLLAAPEGSVWIGTRRGLTHLDRGRFTTYTTADGLGSDLVGALARSSEGDLWIATLNGLSRLRQGHLRNFTTADGLLSNVITALDVAPDGALWIGTQGGGLNLWDGQRFAPVRAPESAQLPASIHAIVHDDRGYLWLASNAGLTRAPAQALAGCARGQACRVEAAHFSTADGLRSRETSSNSHPTALRRGDGELWFTTPRGVVAVDPPHFPATFAPPPAAIERFAVDDQDVEPAAEPSAGPGEPERIAAGHMRFQFDYAGLSFASPQKVRYRYMLEGFDHGWTDAGMRRTAYYTNIPPGTYRFLVRASFPSLGDAESPAEASAQSQAALSFELEPHFYQTLWFRTAAVLVTAALILGLFRGRVLRVKREFSAVLRERNRIAREIHDTLAQGYVGISLQLEILGELLRQHRAEAAAEHLALTQRLVREGLEEARQTIWALRSQDSGDDTLPIRLRRLVEKAGGPLPGPEPGSHLEGSLSVHGTVRALAPEAEQEILRVAQEAIQNVKRHAAARRLSVRLDYDERRVELAVADDGRGFRPLEAGANGHFGLTGMRERAALLGGTLQIESQPGEGTTVTLSIPAAGAPAGDDSERETTAKFEE